MKRNILKSSLAVCVIAFAAAFAGCGNSETPFGYIDGHKIKNFVVTADTSGVSLNIESKGLLKNEASYKAMILVGDTIFEPSFRIMNNETNTLNFYFIRTTSQPDSVAVLSEISQKNFIFDGKTGNYVREVPLGK
ncbi:MAG: hypothetical protein LBK94_01810 [Prevotellaceae bacterium]|nr:hypothetical protein [Prevotellaceae bacterium]